MLKKVNRGLKRRDFEESRARGKLIQGKYWAISIIEGESVAEEGRHIGLPVQFGFVISKKISKLAVERNRIKRLIAEGIRKFLMLNDKSQMENKKIIFLVKRNILEASLENIETELKNMMDKFNGIASSQK